MNTYHVLPLRALCRLSGDDSLADHRRHSSALRTVEEDIRSRRLSARESPLSRRSARSVRTARGGYSLKRSSQAMKRAFACISYRARLFPQLSRPIGIWRRAGASIITAPGRRGRKY
eukprot:127910-Pleurochrysis_carterae.AAC.1